MQDVEQLLQLQFYQLRAAAGLGYDSSAAAVAAAVESHHSSTKESFTNDQVLVYSSDYKDGCGGSNVSLKLFLSFCCCCCRRLHYIVVDGAVCVIEKSGACVL
jgi:hypothetical protein